MSTALAGIRVVELSGPFSGYAGRLLSDLGADVVLVEPPPGDPARGRGPFDENGDSVWFTYLHAGKRSVLHDPADPGGVKRLTALMSEADVLLGSGTAGWAQSWGFDLDDLRRTHPDLVMTSITPFGLEGPWAGRDGTDLVALATGGLLSLGGYMDDAPLQAAGEQAITGAATFAAAGALLALLAVETTSAGHMGQVVDVSIQESVTMALENAAQYYDLRGEIRPRPNGPQRGAGAGLYPCADGYVYVFVGGIASGGFWTRFIDWLKSEEVPELDRITGPEWADRGFLDTTAAKEIFAKVFGNFAVDRDKEWLTREAQARGIPIAPVRTVPEVVASAQLEARGFFEHIVTPHGRTVLAPGAPYRLSVTPWHVQGPAPALPTATNQSNSGEVAS